MSNVAQTSRTAYADHVVAGRATSQRERILAYLRHCDEPQSRADICHAFKTTPTHLSFDRGPEIPLASVCGRVNALLAAKLVKVVEIAPDEITRHRVEYVTAVRPEPVQRSFDEYMR